MTGEAEERSEFLEAMRQVADILTGKLVPARVHRVPLRDAAMGAGAAATAASRAHPAAGYRAGPASSHGHPGLRRRGMGDSGAGG